MSSTRLRPPGFGARVRHRPAGFDARPERPSSLRAQAQRAFRAAAARDESLKESPLPDRPPQAGEGKEGVQAGEGKGSARAEEGTSCAGSEGGGQTLTPLTQQVRALYEAGAVPVREIARLAGVTERTLYKYVAQGGWRRRYGGKGIAAAVEKRAHARKPRPCVAGKGAGGRFIRREDEGLPVAHGMKALDPAGQARALAACERAGELSDLALARARRLREAMSDARTMALMAGVARDLAAIEDAGEPAAAEPQEDVAAMRRALIRKIEAAAAGSRKAPAGAAPSAPPPPAGLADQAALSDADRRINAVAARFMTRAGSR